MLLSRIALLASDVGPNWAEVVTALATGVLGFGVIVALFQLGELRRDRHLQWLFEVGRRWDDEKLEASRVAMYAHDPDGVQLAFKTELWLDTSPHRNATFDKEMASLLRLPNFFEDVGATVRFGRVDIALVWQALSGAIGLAWRAWEPSVKVYRELSDAEAFTEFEELAAVLATYERDRNTLLRGTIEEPSMRTRQLTQRLVSYTLLLLVVATILTVVTFTDR